MVTMACFYFILIFYKDLQKIYMKSDIDANGVLTRKEKEELVLDLYFNQNKTYSEIAKIAKISPRDIKPIIAKAINEKERMQHKSIAVQAYELFYKGKTPLEVAIILNIGESPATAYYWQYLKLVQLEDITNIYQELGSGIWDFVKLCKEAKAAKMGIPQVINLLNIANNYLPSVQHRYEQLQEHNNQLESILRTKSKELQNLNNQITDTSKFLDITNSECRLKTSMLQMLREQAAKMEAFVNNYKNSDQEYTKLKKSIEDIIRDTLSDKKRFLELASFSVIESMRASPDRYSSLVYHNNNENSSKDNNNHSSRQILPPPPYDGYIIEHYKSTLFEESEKLYNGLVDQLVCEVVNENVAKQSAETTPSSLPALPFEEGELTMISKTKHNDQEENEELDGLNLDEDVKKLRHGNRRQGHSRAWRYKSSYQGTSMRHIS